MERRATAPSPRQRDLIYSVRDAQPTHGHTVVSTFAGAGGSSLGYRLAGFRVLWANEFVSAAATCYESNMAPYTIMDRSDIREVDASTILNATGLDQGELDILDGSPPCASFSSVGARAQHWGKVKRYSDTSQRTDDLFLEYARLLRGIQPRYFVAENVVGLTRGMSKGYLKQIVAALMACGYDVQSRVLDAQYLGVPQRRRRLIMLGTRRDIQGHRALYPEMNDEAGRIGVSDALVWPHSPKGERDRDAAREHLVVMDDPSPVDSTYNVILHTLNYRGEFHRQSADIPSVTITASGARDVTRERYVISSDAKRVLCPETGYDLSNVSPLVTRTYGALGLRQLSIPEVRRLCAYPSDYLLVGSYAQRWERLGRSVPPLMMKRIASSLARVMT